MDSIDKKGVVSVIIPVYQAEKFLFRCVSSVISQTYKRIEILLIDDGSSDKSLLLCNKLAKKDSRIKVFHHENKGVAATRNEGLELSTGQFIYFLDSDDWIDKNAISEMVSSIEEDDTDIAICGFKYIEHGAIKEYCLTNSGHMDKSIFMKNFFWELYERAVIFNIGTKLYRRNVIKKYSLQFDTKSSIYEDIRFFLEYLDKIHHISLVEKAHYNYYIDNNNSITHIYKEDFWENTFEYCHILMSRFSLEDFSLKKAVLLNLYRAYLQECHNPQIDKSKFYCNLENYCWPIVKRIEYKDVSTLELTWDQKVFLKLILLRCSFILFALAIIISIRKNKK